MVFTEEVYKCVLSKPSNKDIEYRKINIDYIDGVYHLAKYTDTQVFHENLSFKATKEFIETVLGQEYKNFNSWTDEVENSVQISKKGKILHKTKSVLSKTAPKIKDSHNREKNYILKSEDKIAPLVDMGVITKDGKIVNSMYDKYKQINRFIEIIDDEVKKIDKDELTILDFGCGKSYLTFILYYYFTEIRNVKVKMIGLDLKSDVIEKCSIAAEKYGYDNLKFKVGDISNYEFNGKVDMVITLHACDTATDYALFNAISWDADMIFSVPCCQHEVNEQIKSDNFAILTRYGIVKERFSALVTDSIRANLLEACGYRTQMIEFIDFDHTPKNIMIRAIKKSNIDKADRLREVESIMGEFNISQTLYSLLKEAKYI
ncbi:MAG: SAM-dependent methyltransferase [Tissierellia bacterium]|nr:SAM-dependent methyltransferase [Tissierellia bacterium]